MVKEELGYSTDLESGNFGPLRAMATLIESIAPRSPTSLLGPEIVERILDRRLQLLRPFRVERTIRYCLTRQDRGPLP